MNKNQVENTQPNTQKPLNTENANNQQMLLNAVNQTNLNQNIVNQSTQAQSVTVENQTNLNQNKVNQSDQNNTSKENINNQNDEPINTKAIKNEAKRLKKGPAMAAMVASYIVSVASVIIWALIAVFFISSTLTTLSISISLLQFPFASLIPIILFLVVDIILGCLCFLVSQGVVKASLEISRGKQVTLSSALDYVFKNKWDCLCYLGIAIAFSILLALILNLSKLFGFFACLVIAIIVVIYFLPVLDLYNFTVVDDLHQDKLKYGRLSECMKLIQGHRVEYYSILLSFLGWLILAPFTFGLLNIWLTPYMKVTFANFYRQLFKEINYK